ncbi:MAG: hypothetical protein AAF317_10785, partial [Pseudomonadota bacterium]
MTVFSLPPGAAFADEFAKGFWARFGALEPHEVPRIELLLNNNRSVRVVTEALARHAAGAALLPRISVLAELGADPLRAGDLPPAIAPIRRQLRLTRLVEVFLARGEPGQGAPVSAAPDLARSLATLIDDFDEAGIPLDALDRATEGEHAEHWGRTLRFLDIVREYWPAIVNEEEGGAPGPKARQRAAVERIVRLWDHSPPKSPVIAAASTGSVTTTRSPSLCGRGRDVSPDTEGKRGKTWTDDQ